MSFRYPVLQEDVVTTFRLSRQAPDKARAQVVAVFCAAGDKSPSGVPAGPLRNALRFTQMQVRNHEHPRGRPPKASRGQRDERFACEGEGCWRHGETKAEHIGEGKRGTKPSRQSYAD